MRSVPQRPVAVIIAGLVAVGAVGVTHQANAEPIPTAAAKPQPKPWHRPAIQPPAAPTGAQPVRLEIKLASGTDQKSGARRVAKLAEASDVETVPVAGPDRVVLTVRADEVDAALVKLRKDSTVASAKVKTVYRVSDFSPNDEYFSDPYAWSIADTRLPAAWDTTTGSTDVTVAVIDTGVSDVSELTGALLPGYDFVNNDSNAADDYGHGTMVASLVAGSTNNGANIAAACWTCRILPVKVLDQNGEGYSEDVARGIDFAVSKQVDVINLSLGGPDDDVVLRDAVARAVQAGIVVIAAAGNEGVSTRSYPAANDGVMSVGATQRDHNRYYWSNYGASWVDVAAPGEALMQANDGEIYYAEGTSFAAPLVAGIAALIRTASPEASAGEITDSITKTAVGANADFQYGRVDAGAAVTKLPFTGKLAPSVRIIKPAAALLRSDSVIGVVTGADVVSVQGTDGGADLGTDTSAPWTVLWKPNSTEGRHDVQVIVTAANGQQSTVGVELFQDRVAPKITGAGPGVNSKHRGTITVTASGVSDSNGIAKAELYAENTRIGTDTSSPYAVKYNLSKRNGTVKLQWRITDRAGNVGYFNRNIIADNTAPSVSITSGPKNKAKVKGTVKLKVSAKDTYGVNRVELLINGKKVATDKKSGYDFKIKVSKYGKKLKIQVRAYDNVGNLRYATTRNWKR